MPPRVEPVSRLCETRSAREPFIPVYQSALISKNTSMQNKASPASGHYTLQLFYRETLNIQRVVAAAVCPN